MAGGGVASRLAAQVVTDRTRPGCTAESCLCKPQRRRDAQQQGEVRDVQRPTVPLVDKARQEAREGGGQARDGRVPQHLHGDAQRERDGQRQLRGWGNSVGESVREVWVCGNNVWRSTSTAMPSANAMANDSCVGVGKCVGECGLEGMGALHSPLMAWPATAVHVRKVWKCGTSVRAIPARPPTLAPTSPQHTHLQHLNIKRQHRDKQCTRQHVITLAVFRSSILAHVSLNATPTLAPSPFPQHLPNALTCSISTSSTSTGTNSTSAST